MKRKNQVAGRTQETRQPDAGERRGRRKNGLKEPVKGLRTEERGLKDGENAGTGAVQAVLRRIRTGDG